MYYHNSCVEPKKNNTIVEVQTYVCMIILCIPKTYQKSLALVLPVARISIPIGLLEKFFQ